MLRLDSGHPTMPAERPPQCRLARWATQRSLYLFGPGGAADVRSVDKDVRRFGRVLMSAPLANAKAETNLGRQGLRRGTPLQHPSCRLSLHAVRSPARGAAARSAVQTTSDGWKFAEGRNKPCRSSDSRAGPSCRVASA